MTATMTTDATPDFRLYPSNVLELLAPEACRPWDAQRRGLSIGEAAAFVLNRRAPK